MSCSTCSTISRAAFRRASRPGIPKAKIVADPGIGFGKHLHHNVAVMAGLSLYHGLGVPILLGASRKKMIGQLCDVDDAEDRVAGLARLRDRGYRRGRADRARTRRQGNEAGGRGLAGVRSGDRKGSRFVSRVSVRQPRSIAFSLLRSPSMAIGTKARTGGFGSRTDRCMS